MPDLRAAFLDAARDDPDDDVGRLALADWLLENGDDDRAEFIRLQIALHHGTAGEPARARADELLARHRRDWLPGCDGIDWMVGFRRGLAEVVEIPPGDAAVFAHNAEQLFAVAPIIELSLDPNPDFWPTFVEIPQLRHLRRLRLAHLDAAELAVIVRSPHLSNLQTLDLSRGSLGVGGVEILLDSALLTHVTDLSLAGLRVARNYDWDETTWTDVTAANVGEEGVVTLLTSPKVARLRQLDVRWNRLGPRAVDALARCPHLSLAELRIAERGVVEHDGIDKSQRESASPLSPADVVTLQRRFGRAMRVWPDD